MQDKNGTNYRIHTKDKKIKYAGTGQDSWLTLDQAKCLVNKSRGESIHEYRDYFYHLWEVL